MTLLADETDIGPVPRGYAAFVRGLRSSGARVHDALSRETSSGRFIPELDGLRFAAIGMVILFHLNGYLFAKTPFYEHGINSGDWLYRVALLGSHGVELFFVISGFILALPFAAHRLGQGSKVSLRTYYLRRLTRLEPPYFVTIFLLMFLGIIVHSHAASPLNRHLLASLLYVHNLSYGFPSTVLGVAWSLEIEVQFYFLVPLLTLVFAIRSSFLRRFALSASILICLLAQSMVIHDDPRLQLSIVAYLQYFLLGFLLADLFLNRWQCERKTSIVWDGVALVAWPVLFLALQHTAVGYWVSPLLLFAIGCAAFRGTYFRMLLSNRWLTAIGGMCYSIYLIHYEVISAVGRFTRRLGTSLPNPLFLVLQIILIGSAIVGVCGIYFVVLEKPCMRRDWPKRLWAWLRERMPSRQDQPAETLAG